MKKEIQHYDTDGNLKKYYQERHDLIVGYGWTLIEVKYHKVFNKAYVDELISYILSRQNIKG